DEEQLDPGAPEGETLGLPSSWSKETLRDEWAMLCATYELTLRIGQAYDLLADVRTKVRHRAVLIQVKDKHVRGQAANLRSKKDISATAKDAVAVADIYNHNFDRLVTLQSCLPPLPQGTWIPEPLRRIDTQKDLQVTSLKATRNAGDSKRTRSWIFHVVGPRSSNALPAARRVDWFRTWAAKLRTDEEVNLLIADAWRARAGFRTAAREWRRCVEGLPKYHTPGSKAYALEKADMFDRM
ncbi:hypothetical protein C8Q76DRAFT_592362, partial [Earliella scabrosa]